MLTAESGTWSSALHAQNISYDVKSDKVCIVGGGFGGLYCALAISSLVENMTPRPTITLLDKRERFIFLPLLYELCVGDATLDEVAPTYVSLLAGTGVDFVQAECTGIDVSQRDLFTEDNDAEMSYDALVLATGTEATFSHVPGAEGFALPFYTIEDCFELRRRLNLLDCEADSSAPVEVVVVGAGYSGVELALNIGEKLGGTSRDISVHLIHRGEDILQAASEFNRDSSKKQLEAKCVNILTGTSVLEVAKSSADTTDGGRCTVTVQDKDGISRQLNADLLLWTAGSKPADGVMNSSLPKDKAGRVVTGKTLRVKGIEDVFAIGDCSRAALEPYPATAQVAMQQAQLVACNVVTTLQNKKNRLQENEKLLPFNYNNLGEMMTLGKSDATINSLGGLVQLSGTSASILRRLIYAVRMPTTSQAARAALSSSVSRVSKAILEKQQNKYDSP